MTPQVEKVDARLAIPAIVAWVALGIVLGAPELLGIAALVAWILASCAIAGTILAVTLARSHRTASRAGNGEQASPPRGRASRRVREVFAIAALAATVCGILFASAAVHDAVRRPAALQRAAQEHRAVDATVTLLATVAVDASGPNSGGRRVLGAITAVAIGDSEHGGVDLAGVDVPVLVFGGVYRGELGSSVSVSGTLTAADAGDKVAFLLFARGEATKRSDAPWFLAWANETRTRFHEAAVSFGGDGGALLPGLAIGDTSAVESGLDHAMKATSLSHLTAVSGANCAIVVGLIMVGGGALGLSRRWRIGSSLLLLAAFVILVTPDASVLRAAVMAALVLAALGSGRPVRGLPVLSLAVIILLTTDPWLARDYGFVLSVLATAGLLLLSGPLTVVLSKWMPAAIAALIAIPLAAQLACQPVLILLNPAVPVYGVIANVLAEPAAPAATVIGLVSCIGLAVFPPLGQWTTALAWLPSAWIAAVARFFEQLPGAQAPWIPGMLGAGLMAVLVAMGLMATWGGKARRVRQIRVRQIRVRQYPMTVHRVLSGTLVVWFVVYCSAIVGGWAGNASSIPSDWQIAVCDVGQGDAVVVRSAGEYALIDTGREPELLTNCLKTLGVTHLQLLVLTHYDLDHVGGTAAVLGMVDRALVGPVADGSDLALRNSLAAAGAQVDQVARGATGRLGELRWDVLWPPSRLGNIEPGNPASVTMHFEGVDRCASGCLSSLFLGDLGEQAQLRMMGVARPGPVDVVKVAHHGSADQSERLYERLRAAIGLIGVGADNSYGHPTDRLLDILGRVGTTITRTDLDGMVLAAPDASGGVRVWTERTPERDVAVH